MKQMEKDACIFQKERENEKSRNVAPTGGGFRMTGQQKNQNQIVGTVKTPAPTLFPERHAQQTPCSTSLQGLSCMVPTKGGEMRFLRFRNPGLSSNIPSRRSVDPAWEKDTGLLQPGCRVAVFFLGGIIVPGRNIAVYVVHPCVRCLCLIFFMHVVHKRASVVCKTACQTQSMFCCYHTIYSIYLVLK